MAHLMTSHGSLENTVTLYSLTKPNTCVTKSLMLLKLIYWGT